MSRTLKSAMIFMVSFYSIIIFSANTEAQNTKRIQRPTRRKALNRRVDPADQKLNQILQEWADTSEKINRLEGQHARIVYESTFNTAKYSTGKFLYENPDKGRIDLIPVKKMKRKYTMKDGVKYKIKTQEAERWICDGEQILQVQDESKVIQVIPIPKEAQGSNIMDGPLPFLFGMPPEKARQRYKLELVGETNDHYRLFVLPKQKKDAVNWKEAIVLLSKRTYLPYAVRLTDQTGTMETVYTFNNIEVNKKRGLLGKWFKGDPFNPRLIGYQRETVKQKPNSLKRTVEVKLTKVPSTKGLNFKQAKAKMIEHGFRPKFRRGSVAKTKKLVYCVEQQSPKAGSMINKGGDVIMILYNSPADAAQKTKKQTAAKPTK